MPVPQTNQAHTNFVYASPMNENNRRWEFRARQILSEKENLNFDFDGLNLNPEQVGRFY